MSSSSLVSIIAHLSPVGIFVLVLLLLFSVVSWTIIFYKWFLLRKLNQENQGFITLFWQTKDLSDLLLHQKESLSQKMFKEGIYEFDRQRQKGKEKQEIFLLVERALARIGQKELRNAGQSVPLLATIGSVSPFIGLFGTVVGIMVSFQEISLKGSATLATVAPGIAESLLATAIGLFASIPAVIAYNIFQGKLKNLKSDIDSFALDLLAVLKSQR